jgi:hypothetical protein
MPPFLPVTDGAGRAWRVYEFSIYAGNVSYFAVGSGSGQYRGFVPVDGGARRRVLMLSVEAKRPVDRELLLEQLGKSELDRRDDPEAAASYGRKPERIDPS